MSVYDRGKKQKGYNKFNRNKQIKAMNINFKTVAFFAALSLATASCQKEQPRRGEGAI